MTSTLDNSLDFDDLIRPEDMHELWPHVWSKWGAIREVRQAEFNGMAANGVTVKIKNRIFLVKPKLFKWAAERYSMTS